MSACNVVRVCGAAFLMGFAAAAPIGPVNMMAIRRGLLGGSRHTLVCGTGAVLGDLTLFSLALWGGRHFLLGFGSGRLRLAMALTGLVVLLPFGVYFLVLSLSPSGATFEYARRRWGEGSISTRLLEEGSRAFLLTVLNPLTLVYWIGVTSSWMPTAYTLLGPKNIGWGVAATGAGMVGWFGALVLLVSYVPQRLSATFFRGLNLALGVVLIAIAALCAAELLPHPRWPGNGLQGPGSMQLVDAAVTRQG